MMREPPGLIFKMRFRIYIFIIFVEIILFINVSSLDLMADLRDDVDSDINTDQVHDRLVTFQATYFSNNNRYWQGEFTHSSIPSNGVKTIPNRRNTDRYSRGAWSNVGFRLPTTMRYAVRVDTDEIHGTQGWSVSYFSITNDILIWKRYYYNGANDWMNKTNWSEIDLTDPSNANFKR